MKKFNILFLALVMASCVAPRDKKALYADPFSSESTATTSDSNGSSDSTEDPVEVSDGSGTSGSTNSNIPEYLNHCKWSIDGETGFDNTDSDTHLGPHTICQSKSKPNEVFVQIKDLGEDKNSRVCVIPTYEDRGRAIFLGEARCQFITSNDKIFRYPLIKNRDYGRYQNFKINSVMVMKEKTYYFDSPFVRNLLSYDAFFICSVNLDLHGDGSYCTTFKTKKEYIYKRFPDSYL